MSTAQRPLSEDLTGLARLEETLAGALTDAADEVEHADCLDEEQRAEVYTILQTLKADIELHRGLLNLMVEQVGEYASDA